MVRYIDINSRSNERPNINLRQGAKRWSAQFLKFKKLSSKKVVQGMLPPYQLAKLNTLF